MNQIRYYTDCKCPHCKRKLDTTPVGTETCPHCSKEIDDRSVFLTRRDLTTIPIPRWLERCFIPFMITLGGAAFNAYTYFYMQVIFKFAIIGTALALVYLLFNLLSNDDPYSD